MGLTGGGGAAFAGDGVHAGAVLPAEDAAFAGNGLPAGRGAGMSAGRGAGLRAGRGVFAGAVPPAGDTAFA